MALSVPRASTAGLTTAEIEACRKAFRTYDKNGERYTCSGSIDAGEFKSALNALGQNPSKKELDRMLSSIDEDNSKEIEFGEFLKVFAAHKAAAMPMDSETAGAFIAMGGNDDLTGSVSVVKLKATLDNFGLKLDIDGLLAELDRDANGVIDFSEFSTLFEDDGHDPLDIDTAFC